MGNVSVKQEQQSHKNNTNMHKRKSNNIYIKNKKRRGGQGSPLNPNAIKKTTVNSSKKSKKKRTIKKDTSLYSKLQRSKGRKAYLKEMRLKQFAAQKEKFNSGY
jgi:hypothetical protein